MITYWLYLYHQDPVGTVTFTSLIGWALWIFLSTVSYREITGDWPHEASNDMLWIGVCYIPPLFAVFAIIGGVVWALSWIPRGPIRLVRWWASQRARVRTGGLTQAVGLASARALRAAPRYPAHDGR